MPNSPDAELPRPFNSDQALANHVVPCCSLCGVHISFTKSFLFEVDSWKRFDPDHFGSSFVSSVVEAQISSFEFRRDAGRVDNYQSGSSFIRVQPAGIPSSVASS